ncbi:hypothetical protein B273_0939 [SAR86 cluster bacterium SAR86E]|uniref:Uncharacterized protein n=1 Tax=SAR86 cluster bacterium SAR86E TaxID=1208365 RepID=K6FDI4_9GAMM|nr:hypothetical protein B273_0939 [SAR86 cluster bacterium SAR86E]
MGDAISFCLYTLIKSPKEQYFLALQYKGHKRPRLVAVLQG